MSTTATKASSPSDPSFRATRSTSSPPPDTESVQSQAIDRANDPSSTSSRYQNRRSLPIPYGRLIRLGIPLTGKIFLRTLGALSLAPCDTENISQQVLATLPSVLYWSGLGRELSFTPSMSIGERKLSKYDLFVASIPLATFVAAGVGGVLSTDNVGEAVRSALYYGTFGACYGATIVYDHLDNGFRARQVERA